MALSPEEEALSSDLTKALALTGADDSNLGAYFEGAQRLEQIGLAVPPELRRFETVVNWPGLVVNAIEERCDVKSLMLPGQDTADAGLQEGWDVNDLDSEMHMLQLDSLIYGRGYICTGTNEEDGAHPLITIESPLEMSIRVDLRQRRVVAAQRLFGQSAQRPDPNMATLYLPDKTVWSVKDDNTGAWEETDRDEHNLGRCPVTPFFNRRRTGKWYGKSEMTDAIPLTDAAARSLTNLQIAGETHSVPQKWVLGMSKGDFVDKDGNQIPAWESYFSAIWANQNKDAKVGQFTASDLKNFHETVNHYATLIAGLYGLPMRYMGQNSANPPSADGIRADESRLIKRAERKMSTWGDQLGRVMAIYMRVRDGQWPGDGSRIKVEWHDAATPTYAARVDGIQKLTGGKPILSVEGGWDELGWSETRKDREREYFANEAANPPAPPLVPEFSAPAPQ